jgi:hypothetical protein
MNTIKDEVCTDERIISHARNHHHCYYSIYIDKKEIDWVSYRRELQVAIDAGVAGF